MVTRGTMRLRVCSLIINYIAQSFSGTETSRFLSQHNYKSPCHSEPKLPLGCFDFCFVLFSICLLNPLHCDSVQSVPPGDALGTVIDKNALCVFEIKIHEPEKLDFCTSSLSTQEEFESSCQVLEKIL